MTVPVLGRVQWGGCSPPLPYLLHLWREPQIKPFILSPLSPSSHPPFTPQSGQTRSIVRTSDNQAPKLRSTWTQKKSPQSEEFSSSKLHHWNHWPLRPQRANVHRVRAVHSSTCTLPFFLTSLPFLFKWIWVSESMRRTSSHLSLLYRVLHEYVCIVS